MQILTTGRQIGQTIKNAGRLRQIVGVFAKHGFHNIAERAKLGQFILKRIVRADVAEKLSPAERARLAFEELGPTFVKLGQLLATRPNLIPPAFVDEFKKFHDQVAPVPFQELKRVLEEDFGSEFGSIFSSIDPNPLAAASIAQVHQAVLKTGEAVVIKIQRPGIIDIIKDDIGILYMIAALLEKYVPESKPYNPQALVDEFFKSLELETDFIIEANNIRRIADNFRDHAVIKIPKVYSDFCTSRVIVLEKLEGIPLSDTKRIVESGVDREQIVLEGLRAFFKMVFKDGIFHGDLHAGNIFIMPEGKIGVVDFGIVGRLSPRTRDAIANMLLALGTEDYELLATEYVDLSPYNSHLDFDRFTRDVRELLAPYYGMTFKNMNLGKLLIDSTVIAARHEIIMPSELMLVFKSMVTIEGMGRTLVRDFDLLKYFMEFAQEIIKTKYDPQRIFKDFVSLARDSTSLLYVLPRQIKQLMRKLNSTDFAVDLNVRQLDELKRAVETSGTLTYLGLVVGSLVIAATLALNFNKGPTFYEIPVISLVGYVLAFLYGIVAFYNYVRK